MSAVMAARTCAAVVALTANRSTTIVLLQMLTLVGELQMAWKTPKIVEIALGAEINSYASAGLK
jgi:coenzyme PQQ precursor peptide PqqA